MINSSTPKQFDLRVKNKKNILVVASHPDDEVLGCGGSMLKWANKGHNVHVVILAEGITSRELKRNVKDNEKTLKSLHKSAEASAKILNVSTVKLYNLPDNRMDSLDLLDIVKIIEERIDKIKPHTVVTHYEKDLNIDHRKTFEAVLTACRPYPEQCVNQILSFEIQSSTDWQSKSTYSFMPNYYEDISNTLPQKLEALKEYQFEMREWPHSRSLKAIEHLARWRGSNVGLFAAESFMIIRKINKNG